MKLIAISGSLRKASFNTRLANLIADTAPGDVTVDVTTLHGIPLYNADDEAESGIPEPVESLRGQIKAADGLILVTPEYNAAMPGVFKNALDWLTRPGEEMKPTFSRPTALAGATPGAWGTAYSQAGSLVNLRQMGCLLFPDHLRISKAGDRFDGEKADDKLVEQVDGWLTGFVDFVTTNN
ncbi:NAD(P)H-dependent oxidoreductase [Wenzhouxiangella sp. XN201]|uniref:NADPH-dependent FMN reductase n=1 Tax=Wenzhouxiangella sp. XN201 TaxID=2710755 RepID=UPI0013CAB648|nr:NADPH-dependent FMN reductase [Wenzhouxiangella sp. XN201]NEZ04221.1 NAD(P)H-dependent oxidoreductase [Wenzhouxiangella sp. XN201]